MALGVIKTNYGNIKNSAAAEVFDTMVTVAKTAKAVAQSKTEGYELVKGGTYTDAQIKNAVTGAPGELAPGLMRAEVVDTDGNVRKIMIYQPTDPNLYDRFAAEDGSRRYNGELIDGARKTANLPTIGEFDITKMETTQVDPSNKDRKLTVGELTWKNLLSDWKVGIDNGSINADDPRAKLFAAIRAKGALESGLDMTVLDISMGQNLAKGSKEDFRDIVDEGKLDAKLAELFANDAVQSDFQKNQAEAVNLLPNKDEILSKLKDVAFSEDYIRYLNGLSQSGQSGIAEADIAATYSALATFDPSLAADFARSVQADGVTIELDRLIADPSLIDDENMGTATQDVIKTLLGAAKKGGIDMLRRGLETDRFIEEVLKDKQTAATFGRAMNELGHVYQQKGNLIQADIDRVFSKEIYKGLNEGSRGVALQVASNLNSTGSLGATGGLISLVSGIYQLAGKGGTLADTPEERVSVAKDFISFAGVSSHFVNLGSRAYDKIRGTKINTMLGLDKTLPELFRSGLPIGGAQFGPDEMVKLADEFEKLIADAPEMDREALAKKLNLNNDQLGMVINGYEKGFTEYPLVKGSTPNTRAFTAFLRVVEAGANVVTGVADVVLGGLKIKRSVDVGDEVGIAHGAITVASGLFTFAGGAAQAAGLIGVNIARLVAGPFLLVGAAFAVALTPFLIVEDVRHNNNMDKNRDDIRNLFATLDNEGVLVEKGYKRFEFLDDYMYSHGERDTPDGISLFEYRADEYAFYDKHGRLPENGFDSVTHHDYKGDGPNLNSQLE